MKISRILLVCIYLFILAVISGATYADTNSVFEKVTSDEYLERLVARATQGVVNATLSWTELYVQPVRSVRDGDRSLSDGVAVGFSKTLYFTMSGVWDLGTFWWPGDQGKEIAVKESVTEDIKRREATLS